MRKLGRFLANYYYWTFIRTRLNLTGLIRGFMEYSTTQGMNTFPYFAHPDWHLFLWRVQSELIKEFPDLVCIVFIELRGQKTARYLRELAFDRWYHTEGTLPYARIRLVGMRAEDGISYNYPGLREKVFKIASSIPNFLVGAKL